MLTRPLLLNGFMGTGKTTVGRAIAARLGLPFTDLDAAIEGRTGRTIAELFQRGEPQFRAIERQLLAEELDSPAPRVIALGGGALVDRTLRLLALERATVVTLHADAATVAERVAATSEQGRRPLLAVPDREAQIALLLASRAEGYAEAHAQIDARGPVEEVIARVLEVASRDDVVLAAGHRTYRVRVSSGEGDLAEVLEAASPTRVLAITDSNVAPLASDDLRGAIGPRLVGIHVLEAGERSKSVEGLIGGWDAARAGRLDREAIIVGIGGGVVTDLAGFVAGTWLRGVRWVSCPTTLLGMVDAGIGGKTAIHFGTAKNNVGVFHQPIAVCINVGRIATEPRRSFVSGLAEVVKSALVGDAQLLAWLERDAEAVLARDVGALRRVVRASAAVKASIVSRDEHEGGLRAVLNLGHTLGHALEASGGFGRWMHGEAVSLGLVAALRVGVRIGVTPKNLPARIEALLSRLDLPIALPRAEVEAALPYLAFDKKRGGSDVRFVFVEEPGRAAFEKIPLDDLSRSFLLAAD